MEEEVVPDELRCRRSDNQRWRCRKAKLDGQRFCQHHFQTYAQRERGAARRHWEKRKNPDHEQERKKKKRRRSHVESECKRSHKTQAKKKTEEVYMLKTYTTPSIEHAKEVQANLDHAFPSFVKSLQPSHVQPSHVGRKSKLGLPAPFCHVHLPNQDVMIQLIDEKQKKYVVKYYSSGYAFSVGWKEFSIAHELVVGDALVFQLVKPTEFQVYIVRAHNMDKTDPLIVDACQERVGCRLTKMSEETVEVRAKIFLLESLEPPYGRTSENCDDVVGSEILEGVKFSRTPLGFKDINGLESFTIEVNGLIIDSELSEHARSKYYKLCCKQKSFLHDNLCETINCKLAAGIISQTINIADDIRTRKFTTSGDEFAEWDKNLAVLEQLGMNVGFLRTQIEKLVNLGYESEGMDSKKYREATLPDSDAVKEVTRTQLTKHGGKFRNGSEDFSSEVVKGLKILRPLVDFKDINVLQNFPIAVNGLILNSDLSEQERKKYCEMCCSQKAFLHDNLCETINCKFAVGLISQTIKIADEMRACKLTTSRDEFVEWDKTLEAFEQLGMNVGFLRARIKRLVNLVNKLKGPDRKKYRKDVAEIDDVKEEMRTLKAKLVELEEASKRCDTEIETLEEKAQQYQLKFQAEVEGTWEESKSSGTESYDLQ